MDYRKVVNSKKKIVATVESIKNLAIDKSKEVKEYTGSTVDEFKDNIKTTAKDVKTSISNSVKTKLENEFRKHYPSYAISYVDNLIVDSILEGKENIVISMNENEGTISMLSIFDEISNGMISEGLVDIYKSENVLKNLFDYLATYYSTEEQLLVEVKETSIVISIEKVSKEEKVDE